MEITEFETSLTYMSKEIPVTIDDDYDSVDTGGYTISFKMDEIGGPDTDLKTRINNTGCCVAHDSTSIIINLSEKFREGGTIRSTLLKKVNFTSKVAMNMVFNRISNIDNLVVYISEDASFILPVIDYVVDRFNDIENIRIHVDAKDDVGRLNSVKENVEYSAITMTREAMTKVTHQIYGTTKRP